MLRGKPGVWESLNKGTNPVLLAGIGPVNPKFPPNGGF